MLGTTETNKKEVRLEQTKKDLKVWEDKLKTEKNPDGKSWLVNKIERLKQLINDLSK